MNTDSTIVLLEPNCLYDDSVTFLFFNGLNRTLRVSGLSFSLTSLMAHLAFHARNFSWGKVTIIIIHDIVASARDYYYKWAWLLLCYK